MALGSIQNRLARLERATGKWEMPLEAVVILADGHTKEEIREFLDARGIPPFPIRPTIIFSGKMRAGQERNGPRRPLRFME